MFFFWFFFWWRGVVAGKSVTCCQAEKFDHTPAPEACEDVSVCASACVCVCVWLPIKALFDTKIRITLVSSVTDCYENYKERQARGTDLSAEYKR